MITLPPPSCRLLSTNPCLMHPLLLLFFSFFLRFKFELYSFLCSSHLDAERHIDEWERIGGRGPPPYSRVSSISRFSACSLLFLFLFLFLFSPALIPSHYCSLCTPSILIFFLCLPSDSLFLFLFCLLFPLLILVLTKSLKFNTNIPSCLEEY